MSPHEPISGATTFESRFRVRSYELDGYGHLNHAVYLNYFETARFDSLAAGGFSHDRVAENGWAIHVVRVEVDFRREALLGQAMLVRTRVSHVRTTSMTLEQVALDPTRSGEVSPDASSAAGSGAVFAEAKVVLVWIGPDRKPMRIPREVRAALGVPEGATT